jgi:DNA polymerase III alpha subunit
LKQEFITSAAERGVARATIDKVFEAFEPFANYGFNKAHATCYGLIAYQTAYLKANYTVEYMTSVLNAFRSKEEKVAAAIAECRRLSIPVLPPDVDFSNLDFEPEGEAIRFGLLGIKNVGATAAESIVAAREAGEQAASLQEFCERIDLRLANKRVLEALAKVGALRRFGHPAQILLALDDAISGGSSAQRERAAGQVGLFDAMPELAGAGIPALPHVTEASTRERLRWERELMGVYLSDHPMNALAPAMQPYVGTFVGDFSDESYRDETATLGAIVLSIRQMVTKKGASMAIVTVEDLTGSMEVVVFPQVWESTKSSWIEGEGILIAGRTEQRGEEWSVLVESVVPWEEASRLNADAVRSKLTVSSGGRRYAKRSVAPLPNGGIPAGMVPEGMETSAPLMPERAPAEFDAAVAVEAPPAEPLAGAMSNPDPAEIPAGAVLHIKFKARQSVEETIRAMEIVKGELRARPGATRVVVHIPQGGGAQLLPMEQRNGVAWDAGLPAILRDRVGGDGIELELISPTI